jgi:hypothetical protein
MKKEQDECSACLYCEQSFNLMWCRLREKSILAGDYCNSFWKKADRLKVWPYDYDDYESSGD